MAPPQKERGITMTTITIYTIHTGDAISLGQPAGHTLEEPVGISRTWIARAEYVLPEGYHASKSSGGTQEIYNAAGHHCPLSDSAWMGKGGGHPVLVDSDADPWRVKLEKVRDLPW